MLQRCLQRDLRRRLRDIGDVCADLDEPIRPRRRTRAGARRDSESVSFQRLTDLVGVNESPALSPDGRMVAFVAPVDGRRQIWIRMLSGGAPLRVTHDEGDHEFPRWTTDGSAIVYYARPAADRRSRACSGKCPRWADRRGRWCRRPAAATAAATADAS